jgi:hypothetical protein
MNPLTIILVINSVGILIIYIAYRFFSWLLIERDPFLNPVKKDRSLYKPYFFARENGKTIEKCLMDQDDFPTTEILNGIQVFDKTIRNDSIKNEIDLFKDKKTVL